MTITDALIAYHTLNDKMAWQSMPASCKHPKEFHALAEMPETKKLSENLVRQYKPHQKGLHEPSMLARELFYNNHGIPEVIPELQGKVEAASQLCLTTLLKSEGNYLSPGEYYNSYVKAMKKDSVPTTGFSYEVVRHDGVFFDGIMVALANIPTAMGETTRTGENGKAPYTKPGNSFSLLSGDIVTNISTEAFQYFRDFLGLFYVRAIHLYLGGQGYVIVTDDRIPREFLSKRKIGLPTDELTDAVDIAIKFGIGNGKGSVYNVYEESASLDVSNNLSIGHLGTTLLTRQPNPTENGLYVNVRGQLVRLPDIFYW
mgnify:CR=1 FL=1|jgi:hypothetical protein